MAFMGGVRSGTASKYVVRSDPDGHPDLISNRPAICFCAPFVGSKEERRRTALKKERIRQFSIWHFEMEDQREEEHIKRRLARKKKRQEIAKLASMKVLRALYFMIVISCIIGLVFTLCSTVKTIGELTPMYKKRELYRIVGPLVLTLAVLLLIVATALKHHMVKRTRRQTIRFYYIEKNKNGEQQKVILRKKRRYSEDTEDSGNVEDIELLPVTPSGGQRSICESEIAFPRLVGHKDSSMLPGVDRLVTSNVTSIDDNQSFLRQQRLAWAKTKWMRMDSRELDGAWDDVDTDAMDEPPDEFGAENENATCVELGGAFESSPIKDNVDGEFSRNFSVKSKDSSVSNFSNFSETANLIKKK